MFPAEWSLDGADNRRATTGEQTFFQGADNLLPTSSAPVIVIRELSDLSEYDGCVDVQLEVWQFDPIEVVPAAHLAALHHYGGMCLGAFDQAANDRMVGFAVGFTGWNGSYRFHHSHMLAVRPAYRGLGLGEDLKWAQREKACAAGFDLMNWTFDPLQAPNANLNINRLGVVVGKYKDNAYGESESPLHGGLPTDRFEAEWRLSSPRVQSLWQAKQKSIPVGSDRDSAPSVEVIRVGTRADGLLVCEQTLLNRTDPIVGVQIPLGITEIMAKDKSLALQWRMATREVFHHYFEQGYWVVGLNRSDARAIYELRRNYGAYDP